MTPKSWIFFAFNFMCVIYWPWISGGNNWSMTCQLVSMAFMTTRSGIARSWCLVCITETISLCSKDPSCICVIPFFIWSQVASLKEHEDPALAGFQRVDSLLSLPISEINPEEFQNHLEEEKKLAGIIALDVKDAKRRLTAAKGPSKKRKVSQVSEADDDDESN